MEHITPFLARRRYALVHCSLLAVVIFFSQSATAQFDDVDYLDDGNADAEPMTDIEGEHDATWIPVADGAPIGLGLSGLSAILGAWAGVFAASYLDGTSKPGDDDGGPLDGPFTFIWGTIVGAQVGSLANFVVLTAIALLSGGLSDKKASWSSMAAGMSWLLPVFLMSTTWFISLTAPLAVMEAIGSRHRD